MQYKGLPPFFPSTQNDGALLIYLKFYLIFLMQADWMGSFWKQKKTLKTSKQILQINTVYIIVRGNFQKILF